MQRKVRLEERSPSSKGQGSVTDQRIKGREETKVISRFLDWTLVGGCLPVTSLGN